MTDPIVTGFVLITLLLDVCYSDQRCSYYDRFNHVKHLMCSDGCCGNYHQAYCCEGQNIAGIVVGSFVGAIILAIIVGIVICWCKQRRTRIYKRIHVRGAIPNYGSTRITDDSDDSVQVIAPNVDTDDSVQVIAPNVDTDDSQHVIVPSVEINVTPATPELPEPKQT